MTGGCIVYITGRSTAAKRTEAPSWSSKFHGFCAKSQRNTPKCDALKQMLNHACVKSNINDHNSMKIIIFTSMASPKREPLQVLLSGSVDETAAQVTRRGGAGRQSSEEVVSVFSSHKDIVFFFFFCFFV